MAKGFVPLALLFILAACGNSKQETLQDTFRVRGTGFSMAVQQGWQVSRSAAAVTARSGSAVVSVTRFTLRKPYEESQFDSTTPTLDRVAAALARHAGAKVDKAQTVTIAGRKARAYVYAAKKIAFVLAGRNEYQLYCSDAWSSACLALYAGFTLQ